MQHLRGVTPAMLQGHIDHISTHVALIEKAKAYAHNFDKSKAAIRVALKSLVAQLTYGHNHDKDALITALKAADASIKKAQTEGKVKVLAYRAKACPSKRIEEELDAKKAAAKAKVDRLKAGTICSAVRDMDVDKTTPRLEKVRCEWDKRRNKYVEMQLKYESAKKDHSEAILAHNSVMAKFKTALAIEVNNAETTCRNAHKQYETLKAEVAANVASRKQVFIATLVVECYITNASDNAAAKACADKSRKASTARWNINPPSLASCPSKATLTQQFGPAEWRPTVKTCKGVLNYEYVYKGCYSHKSQNLLDFVRNSIGKIDRDLTWKGCAKIARGAAAEWFGEEYPQGDASHETASCGLPRPRDPYPGVWDATSEGKLSDEKCNTKDKDGHRMGGPFAIALYVKKK